MPDKPTYSLPQTDVARFDYFRAATNAVRYTCIIDLNQYGWTAVGKIFISFMLVNQGVQFLTWVIFDRRSKRDWHSVVWYGLNH